MSCTEGCIVIVAMVAHGRLRAAQRFFRTFLEGREDREVRVSDWRRHPAVGRLREVSFVSAVKRTMGISPPFAHCHQTQRYRYSPLLHSHCRAQNSPLMRMTLNAVSLRGPCP